MVHLTISLSLTSKGLRLLGWHLSDVLQHQAIQDAVQWNTLATFCPEHLVLAQWEPGDKEEIFTWVFMYELYLM